MSDMPDEIWLIPEREGYHLVARTQQSSDSTRYIRADIYTTKMDERHDEIARLRSIIEEAREALQKHPDIRASYSALATVVRLLEIEGR